MKQDQTEASDGEKHLSGVSQGAKDLAPKISRRKFLTSSASMAAAASIVLPACSLAPSLTRKREEDWEPADLIVDRLAFSVDGRPTYAVALNGSVPGPTLRFKEGEDVVLRVQNRLDVDTSIHWHGLILPPEMDGVPGVSFRGIAPGETFTYRIPIRQNGTYWYHSHSGFQEQLGMFGPIIIEPAKSDPFQWDVDHVVMLSDWTFENPSRILARLKKSSGYYNYQKPTIADDGLAAIIANRMKWGAMRMDPTDISDVTGATYTYMVNGTGPETNWTGLFSPGQKVRLRFVNAGAATYFDVRIPGLSMTVVQVDGQNVEPVVVDEIRVAIAETYDVIVTPKKNQAYTVFAESMDRSGFARGTLAPQSGMSAAIPERRPRPLLTMKQMGMGGAGAMGSMASMPKVENSSATPKMAGMGAKPMAAEQPMAAKKPIPDWAKPVTHNAEDHGPGNTRVAPVSRGRLDEPGIGLEDMDHRVLVYTDLKCLVPGEDQREPEREIEMHLTGNMERYIWGFDGKKYSEASEPIQFRLGERLRLTFVNDTMMNHPIHLHGMWMELVNGAGERKPRKHTFNVKPAERVSVDITVDAPGRWAMHCHILYHMDAGMFRVVEVVDDQNAAQEEYS
ncbi:MAG: copper resistance protein CopA [Planctomycetota bacterium]|nr:MAG: copper resistance protein CopA [Planctomycetota bacterium]